MNNRFDKDTLKIRTISQKLIWMLSSEMPIDQEYRKRVFSSINWLSAIVCDDWPRPGFKEIYEEINDYAIHQVVQVRQKDQIIELWQEFCQEVAAQVDKPVYFGDNPVLKVDRIESFMNWRYTGESHGFIAGKIRFWAGLKNLFRGVSMYRFYEPEQN
ncbi:hypothetical protein [Desulfospira joergensenii]|uniref:hypothetical protein n=1 Tax=Desulfospira joergensenii TaxID=53329 RepID=UPI0003B632DA|nr:hypothetical protein [Desulfospira joergensenii]